MTLHTSEMEGTTIGEFLRETRIKCGRDLEAMAEETKISPRNLQAIEDGNFTSLPAEVFTRGFYSLYAKALFLDPDEVLAMYGQEKMKLPKASSNTRPPNRLAQNMANLADRPTSLRFSYFFLVLFLFLLFGAFLCWYFSWNPASFLSEKLRSLEDPQQIEQAVNEDPRSEEPALFIETQKPLPSETLSLFSLSTVTAATTQPEKYLTTPVVSPVHPKYIVNAVFREKTVLTLQIDNQPQDTLLYKNGDSITWQADEKIIITLPGNTHAQITLNDIPLKLPKANTETIKLSIPEDILR